ncbi:hypothetical protein [Kribbella sp. NPDC055071]
MSTPGLNVHSLSLADNWQYGIVWRLALADEPHLPDEPPAGSGWILDTLRDGGVRTVSVPAWSDGSIVLQRTRWRREAPGMRQWLPRSTVCEDRRPWWLGSRIPDRLYAELGELAPAAR